MITKININGEERAVVILPTEASQIKFITIPEIKVCKEVSHLGKMLRSEEKFSTHIHMSEIKQLATLTTSNGIVKAIVETPQDNKGGSQ